MITATSKGFANEIGRPTRFEAEEAVRTLIRWAGDDPNRAGLLEAPARFARAFEEYFAGYAADPAKVLSTTFEANGYDEMIVSRGIPFESYCEHHVAPIIGRAWVAYVPNGRVVGISKLARVIEAFAKRLQIQERLTAQVIQDALQPQGVAVVLKGSHHCLSSCGARKHDSEMVTSRMLGCFRDNSVTRQEFLALVE